ncbi:MULTISPECIES: hypothetical protein [Mangrovimonas]|uniref:hypothetical protein n=1 Tax=Mangrovimonas TaxID=1211036 RepID=UPI0006B62641|nr:MULTISPECIES: hypothetical protein [Mangrovimonas]OMP30128.1 hypothetical protein BKM32_12115 [Mangrovimonas sp. DI 80]
MKYIISFIVLLSLTSTKLLPVETVTTNPVWDAKSSVENLIENGTVSGGPVELDSLNEEQLQKAKKVLCNMNYIVELTGINKDRYQEDLTKIGVFNGTKEEFKVFFPEFLKKYSDHFICPENKQRNIRAGYFLKQTAQLGIFSIFDKIFFEYEEGGVDFNSYEIVDGKKETLLDFVEKLIAQNYGEKAQLEYLAEVIRDEYGAKRGSELKEN